jgi:hypothetical protein
MISSLVFSQACKKLNTHSRIASFQGVLTVAAKSLQPDKIVHGVEPQPCGVQVVERVGLVALSIIL